MTTQAFEQFDVMDTQALAAVEGGVQEYPEYQCLPGEPWWLNWLQSSGSWPQY